MKTRTDVVGKAVIALGLAGAVLASCSNAAPDPAPPSTASVNPIAAWLEADATPLHTAEDFDTVAATLSDATIVGLGEATHGTREFFVLKAHLFQALVRTGRFRTLAMELDPETASEINAVLQGQPGDLRALSQRSFFFLEANAILDLLTWMQDFNTSTDAATRLRFVGIDMTEEQRAFAAERCGERVGCRTVFRDMAMAQNVLALGDGITLWAHNGHVAHFAGEDGWRPAGELLREAVGPEYRAVGFEFGFGRFVAPAGGALPVTRSFSTARGRKLAEYELVPPPPSALGHALDQHTDPTWFVSLRAPPPAARRLFQDNRNLHKYGAVPPPADPVYELYPPLPEIFDALIFVRQTHGYEVGGGTVTE